MISEWIGRGWQIVIIEIIVVLMLFLKEILNISFTLYGKLK